MTKNVEEDLTQYLVSLLDVDRFVGLDNAILNYLFAYVQSGACTGVNDAIEQLSETLPSWGVCSFEECREVCSQIGLIAARHNKLLEEKEQNQQLLKEQREKLSSLRSNPQRSAESFVRGVVRPRVLAPHHLRNKEIVKKTDGPDPNEEKFQDPNSSTRLTLIPDLMDVVIVKPAHADRSNPDEIRISEFSMSFSGRALLNNAGLFIQRGRRYGLIGRNGVGKSTLLRHIARGSFNLLNSPDILFIEQEVPGNDASPLEWVLAADVRRTEMLKEEQRLLGLIESTPAAADGDARAKEKELARIEQRRKKEQDDGKEADPGEGQGEDGEEEGSSKGSSSSSTIKKVKRTVAATQSLSTAISTAAAATVSDDSATGLLELYDRMSDMQFETQETRAKMILKGLGFSEEDFGIPSKLFSGGWRMRISLARALFREPTFLFLDEPTNHLDLPGALWLEHFLKEYKRGLVIVSHDRYFLNRVCTDIIYFANETLSPFRGDYSQFEIMHEEQRKHQQKAYETQQKQIEKMQAFIIYNRAKSEKLASAAQSRMKLLDKIEKIEAPTEEQYNLTFRFPDLGSNIKSPFLTMEHLSFAYTVGKPILENVSLVVGLNSRVALVGKNGAGKSTLLKLMGRQLEASAGDFWQRPSLSFVRFSQHAVDEMPHDLDPLTYLYQSVSTLQEYQPPKGNEKLRQHMAQFGVTSQNATKNLGKLSGGERMRVALAKMTLNRRPHLLLLDEPTNHLDLEAREALAKALKAYGGAIIIVTHDQYLITNTCTEIWIVEDKKVTPFKGTFENYKTQLLKKMGL